MDNDRGRGSEQRQYFCDDAQGQSSSESKGSLVIYATWQILQMNAFCSPCLEEWRISRAQFGQMGFFVAIVVNA